MAGQHSANAAAAASEADFALVMEPIEAFRRSQTLFAAVGLGIFDLLEGARATGGLTVAAVSSALKSNPDATERLLDACVGLRLLTYTPDSAQAQDSSSSNKKARPEDDAQSSPRRGTYQNTTAASAFLTTASPTSTTGYITHSSKLLYPLWGHLEDAVREGSNRWQQAFGRSSQDMFKIVYSSSEGPAAFMASMHSFGVRSSPAVVRAFSLTRFQHLVDVGGGTGHLAIEACLAYPQLRASVADLPPVLPVTQRYYAQVEDAGVRARLGVLAFDLFEESSYASLPAEADVFALGRILHDWDEPTCRLLLQRLFARLPSGGAVLLAEKLLAEPKADGPLSAQLQSLNMLVQTKGKERSAAEYSALLTEAGFTNVQAVVTHTYLDAVIAYKP